MRTSQPDRAKAPLEGPTARCPECGSQNLRKARSVRERHEITFRRVSCLDCGITSLQMSAWLTDNEALIDAISWYHDQKEAG